MRKEEADRILALLKSEGKRLTAKRALVYQVIQESESHLPAEEIYLRAKALNPNISLSTVYRTLNILKDLGLVRELHLDEEHHHYELVEGSAHYHMICSQCGKIEEFKSELVDKLAEELEKKYGFETKSIHIDFVGLCADCRNKT
jgi:Fur family ferric uptake transcriptional regulator